MNNIDYLHNVFLSKSEDIAKYDFSLIQARLRLKIEELTSLVNNTLYDSGALQKLSKYQKYYKLASDIINEIEYYKQIRTFLILDLDEEELHDILTSLDDVKNMIQVFLKQILNKDNTKNAILSIKAGSGGTEAEDWAGMLLRMYLHWAIKNNYKTELLNTFHSQEAQNGIKKADLLIKGTGVYNLLKNEIGVHRLVRRSPFDKSNKRHTSFASVNIKPETSDKINIIINEKTDIKIDTLRGSGAGGQHRNKVETAVRIHHIESGITVFCQSERSQKRNKENALKILKSKLYDIKQQEINAKNKELYKNEKEISWGQQIRSYTLHPEQRVKDNNTGVIIYNFNKVLDGYIDEFILQSNIKEINDIIL
jgi:peptide chain release factor 2